MTSRETKQAIARELRRVAIRFETNAGASDVLAAMDDRYINCVHMAVAYRDAAAYCNRRASKLTAMAKAKGKRK